MADIFNDLRMLCKSTNPRIELYPRSYRDAFSVVAEIANLICEQQCTYNKLILYRIILRLLNTSKNIRSILLNSLMSFLDSAQSVDCFEAPDLIGAQAIVKSKQKMIKNEVSKKKNTKIKADGGKNLTNNATYLDDNLSNDCSPYCSYNTTKTSDNALNILKNVDTIHAIDHDNYKRLSTPIIIGKNYLGSQIDLPTNYNLFGGLTLEELAMRIGMSKPISSLFRKLGLCNTIFHTSDIDLKIPMQNLDLRHPINRESVKRLRASLAPSSIFKPRRDSNTLECDSDKTIQSFILGVLNNTSNELLSFPVDFIRYVRNRVRNEKFSTKAQFINEDVLRFLNFACGDIPFSQANGVIRYDPNGVHRLNDYCKFSTTENYINDNDFHKLFKTPRDDAFERYGATSDVDLILKYIKKANVGQIPKLTSMLHKIFDHNKMDNMMTGITSITMLSVLTMLVRLFDDFSFVLYANKQDCKTDDLWANAKDKHVIICINDYNNTSHWFCIGRYVIKDNLNNKNYEHFLYCSCNIVDSIFEPFVDVLYQHIIDTCDNGEPVIRTPIVENQHGGNNCGLWVLNLIRFIAAGDLQKVFQYFTKKVTKQDMLRSCRNFIVNK